MIWILLHGAVVAACVLRILLRPHRQPESRLAWLVVVMVLPFLGVLAYLLLGETSIGRKRIARYRAVEEGLADCEAIDGWPDEPTERGAHAPLFAVGRSVSGFAPVACNRGRLMAGPEATVDAMIADIDAATDHVHLLFYIWLTDDTGQRMAEALIRAAGRGVACRAMVDDLGSRDLVRSPLWAKMQAAGVACRRALEIGNPLARVFNGRIDLRNHRKILVIDNRITYCGSQNCADPAFLPKAKYGPWVDAVMRFTGPVARQNQRLFAADWMGNGGDDLNAILRRPLDPAPEGPGFAAQVIGTGPTARDAAMPEVFTSLMFAARHELFITTPYYVPTPPIQAALCAAANRGVETTVIFPARNDDFAVGATCRSYYEELLTAGVRVHEYLPGLLHTKSLTLDGAVTLIGSANMDRRSFDLNYENNILLHDPALTAEMRARQESYLTQSREVTRETLAAWGPGRRVWNNTLAILGPVL